MKGVAQLLVVSSCLFLLLHSCKGRGDTVIPDPDPDSSLHTPLPTPPTLHSITFILGEDNSAYNQYYTLANQYYRINPDDRTEVVVDSLTALSQVLDFLRLYPTADGRPYGLINLVSHGNEFIDLQATVTPHGSRISPASLQEAMNDGLLAAPDSSVLDSLSVVYLHGCAVGQNQALLDQLAVAFGGRATVKASKLFEYYAYLSPSHNPQSIRHYFARTWYAFYHPDSAYDESALVRQLRRRYPHDTTHWREGLRRRLQDNPSQLYHYSFTVPCRWEELYGPLSSLPQVNSRRRREQWVADNADFRELLQSTHIPQSYFQIRFYRQAYKDENDSLLYGLQVRARAGVICLIQPLTAPDTVGDPYQPYCPDPADTLLFAFSRPAATAPSASPYPFLDPLTAYSYITGLR